MTESSDDVSRIHNRYSLTLINPSSYYTSLVISLICASLLVATTVFVFLEDENFALRFGAVIGVLLATQFLDSRLIKTKEYSKSLHMSLFGNLIWLLVVLSGVASTLIFAESDFALFFIAEGMFIFASFRIGILTTTLGLNLRKAWLVCFIQPLAMFLALIPFELWYSTLSDVTTLGVGLSFLIIASVWSHLTDRAGRPSIHSTHELIQAYLASSKNNLSDAEMLMEQRSKPSKVSTSQIRFCTDKDDDFRLVLPGIHPGPYHPVGGSNIPYLIYKNLNSSAMVMHSVSDHSLNIPSQKEVENYLKSFTKTSISNKGVTCTEPITVQINKARVVGLRLDRTAVLFLSLSPHGMEDLPSFVKTEIEQFATNRKYERVLIVDCHNAMGQEISKIDSEDMLKAAKSGLDTLLEKENYPIEFGYANSDDFEFQTLDLAPGGLGILCMKINGKKFFLGWADANNMENGVREEVVNFFAEHDYNLIEICTSDTHYSNSKVKNRNGYYQFGFITNTRTICDLYLQIAKSAEKNVKPATFEILEHEADVKVMGPKIYEDYSKAIENSLKLSKGFMIGSLIFFLTTLSPLF